MKTTLQAMVGFSHFLGIGPVKFGALTQSCSPETAYSLSESNLATIIGAKAALRFVEFRRQFDPARKIEELVRKNISIVSRGDRLYPDSLAQLADAPICIYVKGDPEVLLKEQERYIGIVGTRRATATGTTITRAIVSDVLTRDKNTVVVSGLAYGIDAVAHRTAVERKGRTIAFLGCGVDIPYPSGNRELYEQIVTSGGAVVSEFPPGQTVVPGLFIARNRLISGISRAVVIVEGSKKSGSLITARYAAEQGKDVFAVPGSPLSEQSEAPNILIKEGAIAITSISDVGDYYHLSRQDQNSHREVALSEDEERLRTVLEAKSQSFDDIVALIQKPAVEVLTMLSHLEMEGCVERGADDRYGAIGRKRV